MKNTRFCYTIPCKMILLVVLGLFFSSCKDKYKPEESFIKIYDDKDGNKNYVPLSMKRTSDDGYLILSAYNGWNIHIMKTDKTGEFLWKHDLPSNYVNAVPNLIERNGALYFVCMDAVGLFTYIMKVDEGAEQATDVQEFTQIQYPLYVHDNQDAVYIQNYNRATYETGIIELDAEMTQIQNFGSVQIYTDVEDKIVHHINYTGKRFPFSVSVTPENNNVLLTGFNNYSFSTVFMSANLNATGVYNGAGFDGGLNAVMPLGGNQYALARFSFSNLYFNPNASLSPTTIDIAESIPAQGKSELDPQKPVLIKSLLINGENYTVYLATTKSNQLQLSFYPQGSDEPKALKYIGQSVPLSAADFSLTEDEGLIILTQTTVLGSFNRIATIKLSKEELETIVD